MTEAPTSATFKQFAGIAGCKPSYVTELGKAGRLVLSQDGKRVLVSESLALIAETRDPTRAGVARRHAITRAKGAGQAGGAPAEPDAEQGDELEITPADPVQASDARRRAKALADKAETDAKAADRDYRASMGELLEAGDVVQALQASAITFRTSLENLPATLAPELAAATDEGRVRVLLQDAIEHALEEISRQFAALAREPQQ